MNNPSRSGYHFQLNTIVGKLASEISLKARKKMYQILMSQFPNLDSILDLGATSESMVPEATYLENFYPDSSKITAAGIEDASHLEKKFPGLKFVKISPNQTLPFSDKQFDLVFSNAVIEHICNLDERVRFLNELVRVGKNVFLTTPNKYFPIEHHTGLPLIHILFPKLFFYLLDHQRLSKFYSSNNLMPMGRKEIALVMSKCHAKFEIYPVRMFGIISNWVIVART